MRRFIHILRLTLLILALLLLSGRLALAQPPTANLQSPAYRSPITENGLPLTTLTGTLFTTWSDPRPFTINNSQFTIDNYSSLIPHPSSLPSLWLASDDHTIHPLDVSQSVLRAAGGLERLNRQRVTIHSTSAETASVHSDLSAVPPNSTTLQVHSIQLLGDATHSHDPHARATAVGGPQPYLSLLCKFANISAEPQNLTYFQGMYSDAYPGLGHYWQESSYGAINLDGSHAVNWVTLPRNRSYYINLNTANMLGQLFRDCTAAADSQVDYTQYAGINLMFNANLDCCAWGGSWFAELDGLSQAWPVTWEPPWAYADITVLAHEMGHSFGMPHSSAGLNEVYDNVWDVMSDTWSYCNLHDHPTYGCLGQHAISYHRDLAGWIAPGRHYTATPGTQTITLQQLTQPQSSDYLMATVPIDGSSGRFYTIETRSATGYDIKLPLNNDSAVIIHEVDLGREEPAHLIDADRDGDTADNEAQWTPGETYFNAQHGVSITVESANQQSAVVTIYVGPIDPHEPPGTTPNDTAANATPISYGDSKADALINPTGDEDYYTFQGNAGDTILATVTAANPSPLDAHLALFDEGLNQLATADNTNEDNPAIEYTLTADGRYYLRVRAADHPNDGGPDHRYTITLSLDQQRYLSPKSATAVGGISAGPEDILHWDGTNWSLYFDGSDLGLTTKKPINAFTILDDGSILLAFNKKTKIGGLGPFLPQDIARFVPTSTGNNTSGTIEWYFDGSDVALTTSGEKITALDQLPDGRLLLSTTGNANVPGPSGKLKTKDEDILAFTPTTLGTTTAGTWTLYFDGSTLPGMGGEAIASLSANPLSGDLYLALTSNFTIAGTSGTPHDILQLQPQSGSYTPTLYWTAPFPITSLHLN